MTDDGRLVMSIISYNLNANLLRCRNFGTCYEIGAR